MKKFTITLAMALLVLSMSTTAFAASAEAGSSCAGNASKSCAAFLQNGCGEMSSADVNSLLNQLKVFGCSNGASGDTQNCSQTNCIQLDPTSVQDLLNCGSSQQGNSNTCTTTANCEIKSSPVNNQTAAPASKQKVEAASTEKVAVTQTAAPTANNTKNTAETPKKDTKAAPEKNSQPTVCNQNDCKAGADCTQKNCTENGSQCDANSCESKNLCVSGCKLTDLMKNCQKAGIQKDIFKLIPKKGSAAQPAANHEQPVQAPAKNDSGTSTGSNSNGNTTAPSNSNTGTSTPSSNSKGTASSKVDNLSFEQQVVALVNEQRAANGLAPLKLNEKLSDAARAKSQDMHDKHYFSHTSPTYGSPFDMLKTFGISYRAAGENIAMGYATPEAVMNAWMNSAGHKANILNSSYTQIGVGYVADGNYWTQEFIG